MGVKYWSDDYTFQRHNNNFVVSNKGWWKIRPKKNPLNESSNKQPIKIDVDSLLRKLFQANSYELLAVGFL